MWPDTPPGTPPDRSPGRSPDITRFLHTLERDLRGPLPGPAAHERLAPRPLEGPPRQTSPLADARRGGVLILFYEHADRLWLPFILRPTYNGVHSGQIGFPGGGYEPDDGDLVQTALREAYEEIGTPPDEIRVLGALSTLYIPPSNYLVYPAIGYVAARPAFRIDPFEVAELIEVPLADLLEPDNLRQEQRPLRDQRPAHVPYFAVQEHIIWGATAMILGELLALPALANLRQPIEQPLNREKTDAQ